MPPLCTLCRMAIKTRCDSADVPVMWPWLPSTTYNYQANPLKRTLTAFTTCGVACSHQTEPTVGIRQCGTPLLAQTHWMAWVKSGFCQAHSHGNAKTWPVSSVPNRKANLDNHYHGQISLGGACYLQHKQCSTSIKANIHLAICW